VLLCALNGNLCALYVINAYLYVINAYLYVINAYYITLSFLQTLVFTMRVCIIVWSLNFSFRNTFVVMLKLCWTQLYDATLRIFESRYPYFHFTAMLVPFQITW